MFRRSRTHPRRKEEVNFDYPPPKPEPTSSSSSSATNGNHGGNVAKLPAHFVATYAYIDAYRSMFPAVEPTSPLRRSNRTRRTVIGSLSPESTDRELDDETIDSDAGEDLVGHDPVRSRRSRITQSASPSKPSSLGLTRTRSSSSASSSTTTISSGVARSRKRIRRTRDDPNSATGSIYSHLSAVPDLFALGNDIMICGINPGVTSSTSGHHFAHRSNHFYPSLHLAGITKERMKPEQDVDFPHLQPISLGLTNLAGRPTAEGSELLPTELIDGVPVLVQKILRWKPRTVCFVGKGISEAFMKGLRQSGAIPPLGDRKKGRSRSTASNSGQATSDPVPSESRPSLQISIPASVLQSSAPSSESNASKASASVKAENGTSSSPSKRRLYTKGNSKDDGGYGIMPICVPHTSRHSDGSESLGVHDVTLFFVTPSSSARVTTHFLEDKARVLSSLRVLVEHLQQTAPSQSGQETSIKTETMSSVDSDNLSTLHLDIIQTGKLNLPSE